MPISNSVHIAFFISHLSDGDLCIVTMRCYSLLHCMPTVCLLIMLDENSAVINRAQIKSHHIN